MTGTINFELVSPEERLVSVPVGMALIPSLNGEVGIGPDHMPYVMELAPGVVKMYDHVDGDVVRSIFIAGGFADITARDCTVLAEEAVDVTALNAEEVEAEYKQVQDDLALAEEEHDRDRLHKKAYVLKIKLEAAKGAFVL